MKHSEVYDEVYLENTRLIYSGISKLYSLWRRENPYSWQSLDVTDSIQRVVSSQWEACFPKKEVAFKSVDSAIRYQNSLHRFFRFLLGEQVGYISDDDKRVSICQNEAVRMVCLYHAVTFLQESTNKERFPDLFESLCDCMRDVMDCKLCYLVYSQRDQTELLSMSSFSGDMITQHLKHTDYNEIRTLIQQTRNRNKMNTESKDLQWSLADTLYIPKEIGGKHAVVMVLDYPRYPRSDWKGEWIYIVFQYQDKEDLYSPKLHDARTNVRDYSDLLTRTRNVLFLRHHILEQCMQKMYILLMGQRSYQYVCPLKESSEINILHLTDLHLQKSNSEQAVNFSDNIEKMVDLGDPIDLLVITGDIVQGNASAGVLEENYNIADKFIRKLAVKLWRKPNGYVRSDWQKRVIIIPGNHDYASMNELETMSVPGAKRITGMGYPAKNEGGPMVKFAYYINFVCHLLGMELDDLIENDLNELRCYRELGLAVYALNTVSQTGPLRTNKVLLDSEIIKRFAKVADTEDQFRLLLCHHSPHYELDYLMDRYYFFSDKISTEKQKEWIQCLRECLCTIHEKALSSTPGPLPDICDRLSGLTEEMINTGKFDKNKLDKNTLLWDVVRTYRTISEPPYYNEQIAALHNSVAGDFDMTQRDRKLLLEGYEDLLRKINFNLSLGGHTHALAIGGKDIPPDADFEKIELKDVPFVEGDKMFEDNVISFGLIKINKDTRKIRWQMKTSPASHKTTADKVWNY